jgi:MFS transporter, DHA1 family, multidrug resistance protein
MLPLVLHGIGVQLAFPTLTLLLLDRFPRQRGGISSVQAFASLLLCSAVAGVMSPLLSGSMLALALGASVLTLIGALAWRWYQALAFRRRVHPPVAHPPADRALAGADPAAAMQAEIAEPR